MYLEHFHLNKSPFAEEPDPEIFFTEAGRAEILAAIEEDIVTGKALIKLVGREGLGKTLLCRVLRERLTARGFEVVYLDNPVGSFDDLLHLVCIDLGMDPSALPEKDMLSEFRILLEQHREQGKQVVLIIDEAEKLFLAALERLMRGLCELGEERVLQVLLAGRPALDANLDQLTVYCSDVDIKGGGVLEPLSEEETSRYLRFRLLAAGLSADNQEEIFTAEAVAKIYQSAGGNLRLINILAEEALQTSSNDKSFLVLLDHVAGQAADRTGSGGRAAGSAMSGRTKLILAGCALAVVGLVLFFFFGRNEQGIPDPSVPAEETTIVPASEEPVPEITEQTDAGPGYSAAGSEQVEEETGEQVQAPAGPVSEPEQVAEQKNPPQEIIELEPDRVKLEPVVEDRAAPVEQGGEQAASQPVQAATASSTGISGEQLYQQRLRASAKWLAGGYHNAYTVQLMMLASEQAEDNLKAQLVQDDYFAIRNNLYILRKKTSPPTLFVFYGTYDSMEQARQARNNMPLFLRKHHPYPLSINDAVKKTED